MLHVVNESEGGWKFGAHTRNPICTEDAIKKLNQARNRFHKVFLVVKLSHFQMMQRRAGQWNHRLRSWLPVFSTPESHLIFLLVYTVDGKCVRLHQAAGNLAIILTRSQKYFTRKISKSLKAFVAVAELFREMINKVLRWIGMLDRYDYYKEHHIRPGFFLHGHSGQKCMNQRKALRFILLLIGFRSKKRPRQISLEIS
ncbi:hypothetical protein WCA_02054 [Escherichia coli KTE2]|nr:hypothetical protein WCA_02054 [Escherichia coli KTE2]